jgi:hypothetical protein
VWNIAASACTPDSATIQAGAHRTTSAGVQHAPGSVDKITLICPVTSFTSAETIFEIGFMGRDSNGTASTAYVRATLFSMAIDSTSPDNLVAVSSNSSATTTPVLYESNPFEHAFDFNHNLYWVRIELVRSSTQIVVANTVFIAEAPPPSDIRLKHDIERLGRLDNGLGFYRFAYNGGEQRYVGVMAQEVEAIRPDAVTRGRDGYLRVFYGRLGLRMQTYEDWLAAGAALPQGAVAP